MKAVGPARVGRTLLSDAVDVDVDVACVGRTLLSAVVDVDVARIGRTLPSTRSVQAPSAAFDFDPDLDFDREGHASGCPTSRRCCEKWDSLFAAVDVARVGRTLLSDAVEVDVACVGRTLLSAAFDVDLVRVGQTLSSAEVDVARIGRTPPSTRSGQALSDAFDFDPDLDFEPGRARQWVPSV